MWRIIKVAAVAMVLTACEGQQENTAELLPAPDPGFFQYGSDGLAGFEILKIEDGIRHISFQSPVRGYVTAYLIVPPAAGPLPAAIYLHPAESGFKTQLSEAKLLAGKGYIVLLIDSPKERPEPWAIREDHAVPNHNRDIYRQHVIETRRAIDLLIAEPTVDSSKFVIIGKNLGGGIAGVLSGVEDRVGRFVIQAAIPELGKFWPTFDHPVANSVRAKVGQERLVQYALETAVTDALNYVDIRGDKRVLYQWGTLDDWLTHEQADEMVARTTGDVSSQWYEEGHGLESDEVIADYIRWLGDLN